MSVSRERREEVGVLGRVERVESEASGEAMVRGRDDNAMWKQLANWLSFIPVHWRTLDKMLKSAKDPQSLLAALRALRGTGIRHIQ
jgi:hypothetical protein